MRKTALAVVLACIASTGCSPASSTGTVDACVGTNCRHDAAMDGRTRDANLPFESGPDPNQVVSVAIMPPNPTLLVNVMPPMAAPMPTQAFTAVGMRLNGTMTAPLTGLWSLVPDGVVGSINSSTGLFTANGLTGGTARVHVDVAGAPSADTMITVTVQTVVSTAGTLASDTAAFAITPTTDGSRDATVVNPLGGAVMPQNVYPADIQWQVGSPASGSDVGDPGGDTNDIYRVTLQKPGATVIAYVHAPAGFTHHWLVDQGGWTNLAQTAVDQPVSVTVDRWISATNVVVSGSPISFQFANGSVSGSVYYWDIAAGLSLRIDDGTASRVSYMPTPPAGTDGAHCVGCHSISHDGRWLIGRLGGGENIGAVFDLTVDLSGNPPPTRFPINNSTTNYSTRWWFASFNPDASLMIAEDALHLELIDAMTGTVLPDQAGSVPLPTMGATHPAWAPDGHAVAFIGNANAWGGAFTTGDTFVMSATPTGVFGTPSMVHAAASITPLSANGNADSYPSWSPDAHWITFAHGDGCRSETSLDSLYLMREDGTNVVALTNASDPDNLSYQPHFSPFNAGGYFWVSFLSKRDYGNVGAGTKGTTRQQIWVTAISNQPGTTDPSQVSYWLPGQSTQSQNIAAFWAPRACRQDGAACNVASQCCSAICTPGPSGAAVCAPPPTGMCRTAGQPCGGSGCCAGLQCISNVCALAPG